jgi:hypothetical protein
MPRLVGFCGARCRRPRPTGARCCPFSAAGRVMHADLEREYAGQGEFDIVLVGADSIATIKQTHGQYWSPKPRAPPRPSATPTQAHHARRARALPTLPAGGGQDPDAQHRPRPRQPGHLPTAHHADRPTSRRLQPDRATARAQVVTTQPAPKRHKTQARQAKAHQLPAVSSPRSLSACRRYRAGIRGRTLLRRGRGRCGCRS